jgi:uncharacterized protein (TIGR03437 family)
MKSADAGGHVKFRRFETEVTNFLRMLISTTFLHWDLTLALAVGPALFAQTPPKQITLNNGLLAISLDSATGNIVSIMDVGTGVSFVSVPAEGYPGLWQLNLDAVTGTLPYVNNSTVPTVTLSSDSTGAVAHLVWKGISFSNGVTVPSAVITVEIRLASGSRTASFTFQAASLGGNDIKHVLFPVIAGIPALGSGADNNLLYPIFGGRLFPDPVDQLSSIGMQYPGPLSMQMMAFYNAQAGLFVTSYDPSGQTKSFQWYTSSTTPRTATMRIDHVFPSQPSDALALSYECAIGTFQGDWTAAADLYKAWAMGTPWVQGALARKTPNWLANLQYGRQYCMTDCGNPAWNTTYQAVLQEQSYNFASLGGPAVLRFWGWEHHPSWYYGDYFPPQGGWTAFDQFVASLHQQQNYLEVIPSMLFLDEAAPVWTTPGAQAAASVDQGGNVITETSVQGDNETHTWVFMNPASQFWQQNLRQVVSTLAAHNVDIVQMDNWSIGAMPDDYSPGHPAGNGGTWQTTSLSTTLASMRAAIAAQNSQMALSSEEISEVFIPYLDLYTNRDLMAEAEGVEWGAQFGGTPVPLFPYVYKPYIQAKTDYWPAAPTSAPISYHFLAYARALTWGEIPELVPNPSVEDPSLSPGILSYFKSVGKTLNTYSRFLEHGTMLPPAKISSPVTSVVLNSGWGSPWSGTADAIQSSAWRTSGGEVGIVLTNISGAPVLVSLPIDFSRWGLIAGLSYTVAVDEGVPLGSPILGTTTLPITVQPQQIIVVTILPPPLTANAVVNAAAYTSASIAPSELLTVFGSNLAGSPSGASSVPLPLQLGGLSVTVQDSSAQVQQCSMEFVSNGQLSFAMPDSVAIGPASIAISSTDGRTGLLNVQVNPVAPGIFSANGNGQGAPAGSAVLVGSDGTQSVIPLYSCGMTAGNCVPAEIDLSSAAQAVAVLYGTGIRNRSSLSAVTVTVGPTSVPAIYAGTQGQFEGLDQVNFQLPASLIGQGVVDLTIRVDGQQSNALQLRFK